MAIDVQVIQDAKDALNEDKVPHSEFMRLNLNGETFVVPVISVLSVVRPSIVTPVPMAPDHLIGVANVRGQIFCIIDAGKVLKLQASIGKKTKATRFLLLRHDRVHLGVWAESVTNLYSVPTEEVPMGIEQGMIMGHLSVDGEQLPILSVNVLFD